MLRLLLLLPLLLGAGCVPQLRVVADPTDPTKPLAVCATGLTIPVFCRVNADRNAQTVISGTSLGTSILSGLPQTLIDTMVTGMGF